ncbi:MAG: alpha/beta hydrolase, partial [Propionibacteriaceae bacterium]
PGRPTIPSPHATMTPQPALIDSAQPDRQTDLPLADRTLDGMTTPPAGSPGLAKYYAQSLEWASCPEGECASVIAPMDYATPEGRAITLKVSRRRAEQSPARGAVFFNPGGPGYSGLATPGSQHWVGLERYDLIGFDVRGTGGSTPLSCRGNDEDLLVKSLVTLDRSPDTPEELEQLESGWRELARHCAEYAGQYLRYVGTTQTAEDLELLRQLLQQEQLNFIGFSYGSHLGAAYAHAHPDHVGRMVLDGAVTVTSDTQLAEAIGFDRALQNWAVAAAKDGRLGHSAPEVLEWLTTFTDELDRQPIAVAGREFNQSDFIGLLSRNLYGTMAGFTTLTALVVAARDHDVTTLEKELKHVRSDGYFTAGYYSYYAITCADKPDPGAAEVVTRWHEVARVAPYFGRFFGPQLRCVYWPVAAHPVALTAADAATTILVISTTGDPATPYEQGQWLADSLGKAVVLSVDSAGHTSYGFGNQCVDTAVARYFREGELPSAGMVC